MRDIFLLLFAKLHGGSSYFVSAHSLRLMKASKLHLPEVWLKNFTLQDLGAGIDRLIDTIVFVSNP